MKFFLWSLLMISVPVLLSGILIGVVRSCQNIWGYSLTFLGGNDETSLTGARVPLFLLRAGAFSIFGLWISPVMFGNTEREIVLAGISIGLIFALVNPLFGWLATATKVVETAREKDLGQALSDFQRGSGGLDGALMGGIFGILWFVKITPRTNFIYPVDWIFFVVAGSMAVGAYTIMYRLTYTLQQKVTCFIFGFPHHKEDSRSGWLVGAIIGVGIGIYLLLTFPFAPHWYSFFVGGSVGQMGVIQITHENDYILGGMKNRDAWLVKLDPSGKVLWQRTFGGSRDYDKICAIQLSPDGGTFVAGIRHGRVWVFRLNARGELLWERIFVNKAAVKDSTILTTPEGTYKIVGRPRQSIAWEVTLSPEGQQISERDVGNKSVPKTIYWLPNGGVLDARNRTGSGEGGISVIKQDAQGEIEWQHTFDKRYTVRDFDEADAIQPTPDGGYIVVGHTTRGRSPLGVWVFKANQEGQIEWEESFGGKSEHYFKPYLINGFQVMKNGGCLLVVSRGWKTWIEKRASSGTLEWKKTFNNVLHTFTLQTEKS